MPREGVPYPQRMLCSLKCELKSIWNALNGKLHSVNGVEGDGSGDVKIVSGDAAVVVTPDASLNQIEVSLDRSQLPSAAVTSVNGEVGAVVLDASEIDSGVLAPGNSVQDDIGSMYTQVQGINSGLTAETTARANADAALQTNINALAATVPESSITPDPLKVVMRDSSGRGYAADPASGATDKSLVTANWASQSGDAAPNNLMHRNGNETVSDKKTFDGEISIIGIDNVKCNANAATTGWKKLYVWTNQTLNYEMLMSFLGGTWCTALVAVTNYNGGASIRALFKQLQSGRADIGVSTDTDGNVIVWQYSSTSQRYARGISKILVEHLDWNPTSIATIPNDNAVYTLDQNAMTMTFGSTVINLNSWSSIA